MSKKERTRWWVVGAFGSEKLRGLVDIDVHRRAGRPQETLCRAAKLVGPIERRVRHRRVVELTVLTFKQKYRSTAWVNQLDV